MNQIAALIVDEGNWLPFSMLLALASVAITLYKHRHSGISTRMRITIAINLFFGLTIATMAFGHLLAVSVKQGQDTLRGSFPLLLGIGILLSLPAWALLFHARGLLRPAAQSTKTTLLLNGWLGLTLLVLGLHNLPIAAPAIFNIAYALHSRRSVGWAILSVAIALHVALFIGSLMFLASGQTFEQFTGIQ